MKPPGSKTKVQVWVVENGKVRSRSNQLATEFGITLVGFLRGERLRIGRG